MIEKYGRPANVVIDAQNYKDHIDELKNWSSVGTQNNTQLWMQISHAGRQTPGEINSSPSAPSDVQLKIPGRSYGIPKPMSEEEILNVIDRFVFTGKDCQRDWLYWCPISFSPWLPVI